jgi:hypothetical protein
MSAKADDGSSDPRVNVLDPRQVLRVPLQRQAMKFDLDKLAAKSPLPVTVASTVP